MPRKEKKFHFIYKTTNTLNGKYYIGMHSTDNLDDGYLGSGKRLRYSVNKYGKDNHKKEILEFLNSRKELVNREKEIVNLNEIAKNDCMNLMIGGDGGFISSEQQRKRAIAGGQATANRLKNDPEFKREHTEKCSINMKKRHVDGIVKYDTFTGKKHSIESIKKMRGHNRQSRCKNSQYGTRWIFDIKNNKPIKIKGEEFDNYIANNNYRKGKK